MITDFSLQYPTSAIGSDRVCESSLTLDSAESTYKKLKDFIGLKDYAVSPGWPADEDHRDLRKKGGNHYKVRWMPALSAGWRRLKYYEFCKWYNMKEPDQP